MTGTPFNNSHAFDRYTLLIAGQGKLNRDTVIGVSRHKYHKGYNLIRFDVGSYLSKGSHQELEQTANLYLIALHKTKTFYIEFHNVIRNDRLLL